MSTMPKDAPYSTLRGEYIFVSAEARTDASNPDLLPVLGKVTVRCSAEPLPITYTSLSGSVGMIPLDFNLTFDGEGHLVDGNGSRDILVPATDSSAYNPAFFSLEVIWDLREASTGRPIEIEPFFIHAPAGEIVNLPSVTPIVKAGGVQIIRGETGISVKDISVEQNSLRFELSNGGVISTELPDAGDVTEAQIDSVGAAKIKTAGTELRKAVDARATAMAGTRVDEKAPDLLDSTKPLGSNLQKAFVRLSDASPWIGGAAEVIGAKLLNRGKVGFTWVNLGDSHANSGNVSRGGLGWAWRVNSMISTRPFDDMMRSTAPRPATGVQGYTSAVGGTTAANYVDAAKIAKIISLRPDLVTHMVGSNDWAMGVSPAQYKTNLLKVMEQLFAGTPDTRHLMILAQGRSDVNPSAYPWEEYGIKMKEIADAYPDKVMYLNANDHYKKLGFPDPDPSGLMTSDRVHMSDRGHRVMAELVAKRLGIWDDSFRDLETYELTSWPNGDVKDLVLGTLDIAARPFPREILVSGFVYARPNGYCDIAILAENQPGVLGGNENSRVEGAFHRGAPFTARFMVEAGFPIRVEVKVIGGANVASHNGFNHASALCIPV